MITYHDIKKDLQKIIEYMEESEAKHFEEAEQPDNHIFNSVMVVKQWLEEEY